MNSRSFAYCDERFSLLDSLVAFADGLFRPLRRGPRSESPLLVEKIYERVALRFSGPELLGVDDENVLLGVISLLRQAGDSLSADPRTGDGARSWALLSPEGDALRQMAGLVKTSGAALARCAGYRPTGGGADTVKRSLRRMETVRLHVSGHSHTWNGSMRLLCSFPNKEGKLVIAVHHWLTSAAFQGDEQQHARVSLSERHQLQRGASRILHRWLSAWLKPGQTNRIRLLRVADHIWPAGCGAAGLKKRLARAGAALWDIDKLPGWSVRMTGRGQAARLLISRPKVEVAALNYTEALPAVPEEPDYSEAIPDFCTPEWMHASPFPSESLDPPSPPEVPDDDLNGIRVY